MTRLAHASDGHTESNRLSDLKPHLDGLEGDVLLLPGDWFVGQHLNEADGHTPDRLTIETAAYMASNTFPRFRRVVYVPGNHDDYGSTLGAGATHTARWFARRAANFTVLNNTHLELDGLIIYGTTLWSSLANPRIHAYLEGPRGLRDYERILAPEGTGPVTARHTHAGHRKALAALSAFLASNPAFATGKPVVVASHHAPSFQSLNRQQPNGYDNRLNAAYASNLEPLIRAHPNIRAWVHGHTHMQLDYAIGATRVVSNPLGVRHNDHCWVDFRPDATLDL